MQAETAQQPTTRRLSWARQFRSRSVSPRQQHRHPLPPRSDRAERQAKDALDQVVSQLQGQKGYVVEVEGYSRSHGTWHGEFAAHGEAVVRYLAEKQIPVWRIHEVAMGNTRSVRMTTPKRSRQRGSRQPDAEQFKRP